MPEFMLGNRSDSSGKLALPTGDAILDHATGGGIRLGELWVVGVSDDTVKHDWATQIARHIARGGFGVALNLPQKDAKYIFTLVQSEIAGIPVDRIRPGISDDDYQRLMESLEETSALPIWIDDTYPQNFVEVRGKLYGLVREEKLRCLIIDYLYPMTGNSVASRQDIAESVAEFKKMATSYEIAIIVIVQSKIEGVNQRTSVLQELADICLDSGADLVALLEEDGMEGVGGIRELM